MTYPQVTVTGYDLPEPFDGIDDDETINDRGTEATYLPSRFKVLDSGVLFLEWEEGGERLWISPENYSAARVPPHE
ncbi:hypothetical protein EXE44_05120 [Halorubrum sp. SS7]|uniref:hypothetical protein n=1 Tax=Halorubrum sp. SS7 TaxID=2518119 RepID=UPI001133A25C|nr:hypothetical protein [Halorubrum sp. SS7]TKX58929.1 hypothetical protein EXE44_05120 [Halorubrum sp. SS7]